MRFRWLLVVPVLGYLALVLLATVGPAPWRVSSGLPDYDVLSLTTWLDADTWTLGRPFELVANILMFVPLGGLVRAWLPGLGWLGATAFGFAVSAFVEVVQMYTPRVSDPRDVVANTLGALVGAVVVALVAAVGRRMLAARRSSAVRRSAVRRSAVRRSAVRRSFVVT